METTETMEIIFRNIPQVEKLLQEEGVSRYIPIIGRSAVVDIIRQEISSFRENLRNDHSLDPARLGTAILDRCRTRQMEKLQRVINGTGVMIHTNLGRAPLAIDILHGLVDTMSGYCNLELHLPTHKRGRRGGFAEELLCQLTSGEDALIVNNNASSVFLILSEFARGKEVVISRGELVQIGGGFRIPDIMAQSGARLVEVGTTNITELQDYRRAVTGDTSMIFSVHQSNFKIKGFTRNPSLRDLSALKSPSILLVRDLGSGNLSGDGRLPDNFEPTLTSELGQGVDLICFSGDKLLGACQAGIIIGRKDLVARLRKNPLMRMLRVDKITYYILQETLLRYANARKEDLPLWSMIFQDKKGIAQKITRVQRGVNTHEKKGLLRRVILTSTFGGGTLPAMGLASLGLQIDIPGLSGDAIYAHLIHEDIPIVGYILDDRFTLDFRTISDRDIPVLTAALNRLIESGARE